MWGGRVNASTLHMYRRRHPIPSITLLCRRQSYLPNAVSNFLHEPVPLKFVSFVQKPESRSAKTKWLSGVDPFNDASITLR